MNIALDCGLQLFTFVKQGKGTDITKVTGAIDTDEVWLVSKKYDGFYTQIHWNHITRECVVFTSSGKEAIVPSLTRLLQSMYFKHSFIIEAEYIYNCEGKLGDRVNSGRLMSYVSNTAKGITNPLDKNDTFKAFDCLMYDGKDLRYEPFRERVSRIPMGLAIDFTLYDLAGAKEQIDEWTADGWEGGMLRHKESIVKPRGRNKQLLKIKSYHLATGICLNTLPGEGKYEGMVGALVIQLTYQGLDYMVTVGSGLTDEMRAANPNSFLGKFYSVKFYGSIDKLIHPVLVW